MLAPLHGMHTGMACIQDAAEDLSVRPAHVRGTAPPPQHAEPAFASPPWSAHTLAAAGSECASPCVAGRGIVPQKEVAVGNQARTDLDQHDTRLPSSTCRWLNCRWRSSQPYVQAVVYGNPARNVTAMLNVVQSFQAKQDDLRHQHTAEAEMGGMLSMSRWARLR
jgi:hypothetical protein